MNGRTRRGLAVFVAGLALAAALGTARADEAPSGDKEARRLFQSAELNFNVGKFAEALTDYQAAYQAKPLPGFLFNIAQCYRNLGDQERARFFFRRYLALDPRAPNKRRVEELIDEMTKQLEAKQAQAPATPAAPAATGAVEPPPPVSPLPSATPPAASPDATPSPAPVPDAVAGQAPLTLTETSPPPPEHHPVWKRWWFWTGAAVVVVGGAAATYFLTRPETVTPGTLQPIDGRN